MFHKIKSISALSDYRLTVGFCEGVTKIYDVKPLIDNMAVFSCLKNEELFNCAVVDVGGYGVIWNDEVDISCDELWENGVTTSTPFDDLIALSDATTIWGLNESTLRKAISYGKLVNGVDVCKFGKQWIISRSAMEREYGTAR